MKLSELTFHNPYAELPAGFAVPVNPLPLTASDQGTKLLSYSPDCAALLNLSEPDLHDMCAVVAGEQIPASSQPLACVYAGHQFGIYVPQLGDGRAMMLGEVTGADNQPWGLQLKGAGPTPFSRGSDGRAVLRSSIREYLCSEAMDALDIPTTRALALVGNDTLVQREQLEPAAICARVSRCFIRFGSFEFLHWSDQHQGLLELLEYCIARYYPDCAKADNPALAFLRCVVERTAKMIALWQAYGFIHGVMNSDNMSILGETLDYGPFAFMDRYHEARVFNHSDTEGRYAFNVQPRIGLWNCGALASALLPLIKDEQAARQVLGEYQGCYTRLYLDAMRERLGLLEEEQSGDWDLVRDLLKEMQQHQCDYNHTFRALMAFLQKQQPTELSKAWMSRYSARIQDAEQSLEMMQRKNPIFTLRTWVAQQAIDDAAQGNSDTLNQLLKILRRPFAECADYHHWSQPPSADEEQTDLSCSS